jgi:superfamily II DNA/RNA helicase
LRGTIDGEFVWPVFTPGARYYAAFPEKVHPPATEEIASLAAFGFSEPVLDAWAAAIPKLNQLQLDAINEFGVLDGADLVVSAPTSSGKTMIGEFAALKGIGEHRRALFLLPLKALVNDKHQEFERKYGPLGLRTVRATGEFNDDIPDLMQGHYDVALMTYEKATALLLANPHLLRQAGTIVIDEVQTIVDESRGTNLEFLLTFLKVCRRQGIKPQIVALSAVIGDTNGLERWLRGRLLRREERPVPLREGVLTYGGAFRFIAPDGCEQQEPLIQVAYGSGSSQDWVIPLLAKLTCEGKKVIVFRETKGETTGCAAYLARTLGLPPADGAIAELPAADPSTASSALRQVMYGGVAFHNADLDREEKLVIERHFRDPASPLQVIVATTTLAMGVNTPASAVVIVGLTHPGEVPYSVAEYKNMIGRAGRLGFNEEGESYIVPPNPPEGHAWAAYVLGQPEDLYSRFLAAGTDPRSLILRVLASAGEAGLQREDIVSFLEESFGAFQERARLEGWEWDEDAVRAAARRARSARARRGCRRRLLPPERARPARWRKRDRSRDHGAPRRGAAPARPIPAERRRARDRGAADGRARRGALPAEQEEHPERADALAEPAQPLGAAPARALARPARPRPLHRDAACEARDRLPDVDVGAAAYCDRARRYPVRRRTHRGRADPSGRLPDLRCPAGRRPHRRDPASRQRPRRADRRAPRPPRDRAPEGARAARSRWRSQPQPWRIPAAARRRDLDTRGRPRRAGRDDPERSWIPVPRGAGATGRRHLPSARGGQGDARRTHRRDRRSSVKSDVA